MLADSIIIALTLVSLSSLAMQHKLLKVLLCFREIYLNSSQKKGLLKITLTILYSHNPSCVLFSYNLFLSHYLLKPKFKM